MTPLGHPCCTAPTPPIVLGVWIGLVRFGIFITISVISSITIIATITHEAAGPVAASRMSHERGGSWDRNRVWREGARQAREAQCDDQVYKLTKGTSVI